MPLESFTECFDTVEVSLFFKAGSLDMNASLNWVHARTGAPTRTHVESCLKSASTEPPSRSRPYFLVTMNRYCKSLVQSTCGRLCRNHYLYSRTLEETSLLCSLCFACFERGMSPIRSRIEHLSSTSCWTLLPDVLSLYRALCVW